MDLPNTSLRVPMRPNGELPSDFYQTMYSAVRSVRAEASR
jgi:hypothetical protein